MVCCFSGANRDSPTAQLTGFPSCVSIVIERKEFANSTVDGIPLESVYPFLDITPCITPSNGSLLRNMPISGDG
jgi:hypothetical protein